MISFKQYLLTEELTDEQKKKVDKMPSMQSHIKDLHKKVFGDSDKIIIPYTKSEDDDKITTSNRGNTVHHTSHTSHVLSALQSAGYHTDDYESGLAYHRDTPNRKMKIGKILQKEGLADKPTTKTTTRGNKSLTVGQLYAADPLRASSDNSEKQLVISKHRYDVAGMSTGRSGWNSCMDMEEGQNRHYLPSDMKHGTLTAYVTRKGDDKIDAPIGRLNLKRFDSRQHTIYRPEGRGYGSMPKGAIKQIHNWASENYPSRPGMYLKHSELYNDDGNQIRIEKPEEMNHDHTGTLQTVHHMISDLHSSHEYAHFDGKHDEWGQDPKDQTMAATKGIMGRLHPAFQLHTMVHQIADRTDDNNKDFSENYEPNSHEFTQEWARQKIDGDNLEHSPVGQEIKKLTPEHALTYHKILHDSGTTARDPEDHPEHQELHAAIIDHIMKHSPAEHKDSVLSDITDESHGHDDYYHPMFAEYNSGFDIKHPLEHTENPRMHHTMLSRDLQKFDSNAPDTQTWFHIGKHADSKLMHELVHGDLSHHLHDEDHQFSFHQGLNENPHGEHLQHEILQNMNLHGGESRSQSTTHSNYTDIKGRNRYSGGGINSTTWKDPASDEHLHSHFVDLAHNTKHQSVKDVLRNREDFKHDEEIQNAVGEK